MGTVESAEKDKIRRDEMIYLSKERQPTRKRADHSLRIGEWRLFEWPMSQHHI
jgi:hypothetical protein